MAKLNLTYASGLVMEAIAYGISYGFQIIDGTGLPSGTVYPALRRLEAAGLIEGVWDRKPANPAVGPPRKHYRLTEDGREHRSELRGRYPLLAKMGK
jgi:DNA-binding PadR family transcriptional regulator